jgi:hypothetical protein
VLETAVVRQIEEEEQWPTKSHCQPHHPLRFAPWYSPLMLFDVVVVSDTASLVPNVIGG